jgi:hypothetical protein
MKDLPTSISVDFSYRIKKLGIQLSELELLLYLKHYMAWQHFNNTKDPYCLIIENIDKVIESGEQIINRIKSFSQDCDIFFPYDGFNRKTKSYQITYSLGFRWGTDAYFLSRNGAKILLNSNVIKQNIEDEIMELGRLERLNMYYEDTYIFKYGTDTIYKTDRNEIIAKTILALNIWDENDKIKTRNLVWTIFNITLKEGIELFLSDGTLLGYVRHGQIMGWDDDIDFSMNMDDLGILLNAVEKIAGLNICKWYYKGQLYYKIWDNSGIKIPNRIYKFPFIDIWLYKKEKNMLVYNYGDKYSFSIIFPLKPVFFEGVLSHIPFDPLSYLDLKYKDWRSCIKVFPLRHKTEMYELIPLVAEIKTNTEGSIINGNI